MKHDEVVGYIGSTFGGVMTYLQTNETLQIIQGILSIGAVALLKQKRLLLFSVVTTFFIIYSVLQVRRDPDRIFSAHHKFPRDCRL